jgi:hypothetical protein
MPEPASSPKPTRRRFHALLPAVRWMALGYIVGLGSACTALPPGMRGFLIVWPLCMAALDVLLQRKGTIGEAMDRDEERRRR